jgi:hypothetical protein
LHFDKPAPRYTAANWSTRAVDATDRTAPTAGSRPSWWRASSDQRAPRGRNIDQNSWQANQMSPALVAGEVRRMMLTSATQPRMVAACVR